LLLNLFNMIPNSVLSRFLQSWNTLPLIIRAIFSGFVVSTLGIAVWSAFFLGFTTPWSILLMIFVLYAYWKFFSGIWGPGKTAESRSLNFRRTRLSSTVWKWGLAAAISFVIIVQSSFVITFRIWEFPAAKFTADYKLLEHMPFWKAWAMLIMSSVVAGICEETGYRGYLQVPLEKKYGPVLAVIVTSVIFTLIHLTKTWAHPILPHIFSASVLLGILAYKSGSLIPGIIGHSLPDIFDYSIWWTNLTGGIKIQTIFKTGIDLNFLTWILVFFLGLIIFFQAISRFDKGSSKWFSSADSRS
jgi:membrane protease YdiL (CAAX protease family)